MTVETRRIGGRKVERIYGEPTTVEFVAGMKIDADGALRAYHPDEAPGLDQLEHAGAPGNWWGIVTDDGTPGGEPLVQGEGDPAPGFYVSQTSLADPDRELADPQRYVDAAAVPYLALQQVFVTELGCKLGDFAFVSREANDGSERTSAAIFADVVAPELPVGEGSIALAERLGVPSDPRRGGALSGLGPLRALLRVGQRAAANGRGDRRRGRASRRSPPQPRRRCVPASLMGRPSRYLGATRHSQFAPTRSGAEKSRWQPGPSSDLEQGSSRSDRLQGFAALRLTVTLRSL